MAQAGYKAKVLAQSSGVAFTTEATTTSDNITYTLTDAAKRLFKFGASVVVYDSAVITTESYKVLGLSGQIVFETATPRVITVSGTYVLTTEVATANAFTVVSTTEVIETTPFSENGYKEFTPTLNTSNVDITRWYASDDFFIDSILNKEVKILELYMDRTTNTPLLAYGLLTTDTTESSVEGAVSESLNYQITTEVNYGG